MSNKREIVRRCSNLGLFTLDLILDYLPKIELHAQNIYKYKKHPNLYD